MLSLILQFFIPTINEPIVDNRPVVVEEVVVEKLEVEDVQDYIVLKAREAGINETEALRVASCESKYDPKAKNKYSSAKGIYQFINKTWKAYCEGDVFDYKANTDCFTKLYPKHKNWWEC